MITGVFSIIPVSAATIKYGSYYYEELEDGTVAITDYIGTEVNLYIVSTINGKAVTKIGPEAFQYSNAKFIKLPKNLVSIEERAFANCSNLKEMVFPKTLEGCSALTEVNFNKNIQSISGFRDCSSLKSVLIPKNAELYVCWLGYVNGEPIEDFVMYGYRGSNAERYATFNNLKFVALEDVMLGDVNGDGIVNITDATCIQKYCVNLLGESDIQTDATDVDGNGVINVTDATAIQKMLVSKQ